MRLLVLSAQLALATLLHAQFRTPQPIAKDLVADWVFTASSMRKSQLQPMARGSKLSLSGSCRFQGSPLPPAMVFATGRDRAVVSPDLTHAALPRRAFTIECLAVVDRDREWGGLVSAIQDNGDFEKGLLLGYRRGRFCAALSTKGADDGNGKLTYLQGRTPLPLGRWAQVAMSFDGAELRLYVDGELDASSKAQSGDVLWPQQGVFELGAYHDENEDYPFEGLLGRVRIWKRALAPEELRQLHGDGIRTWKNAPAPESQAPVLALDSGAGLPKSAELRGGTQLDDRSELASLVMPDASARVLLRTKRLPAETQSFALSFWLGDTEKGRELAALNSEEKPVWGLGVARERLELTLHVAGTAGAPLRLRSKLRLEPFRWYHAGFSWDASAARLYVGGKLELISRERFGRLTTSAESELRIGNAPPGSLAPPLRVLRAAAFDHALPDARMQELATAAAKRFPVPIVLERGPILRFLGNGEAIVSWKSGSPCRLEWLDTRGILREAEPIMSPSEHPLERLTELSGFQHAHIRGLGHGRLHRFRFLTRRDDGMVRASRSYAIETEFDYESADETSTASPESPVEIPERILDAMRAKRGFALVFDDLGFTESLARQTELQVKLLVRSEHELGHARRRLAETGLYGVRATVQLHTEGKLPFGHYLFDLVHLSCPPAELSRRLPAPELARLLRPCGGIAWIEAMDADFDRGRMGSYCRDTQMTGWQRSPRLMTLSRGPLDGARDWSSQYGNLAKRASSGDLLVRGPLELQWFGRPGPRPMLDRGCRSPAPVTAAGRMFVQGDRRIFAVDAYNGAMLWTLELPELRRVNLPRDCSNWCVDGDRLWVAIHDATWELDAATGRLLALHSLPMPARRSESWGYLGVQDGLILGTRTQRDAIYYGADGEWYDSAGAADTQQVLGHELFALENGKLLWQRRQGLIVHPTIAVHEAHVYFVEDRKPSAASRARGRLTSMDGNHQYLVALDLRSGKELWSQRFDFRKCQRVMYLSAAEDRLVVLGTAKRYHAYGFDRATGRPVWSHEHAWKRDHHGGAMQHPVIVGGVVYAEMKALDLRSGKLLREDLPPRRGCGTMSASAGALFFRHYQHGIWDLETDERRHLPAIRSGCWLSIVPSQGLMLAPESSSGCSCADPIQCSVAYRPTFR